MISIMPSYGNQTYSGVNKLQFVFHISLEAIVNKAIVQQVIV